MHAFLAVPLTRKILLSNVVADSDMVYDTNLKRMQMIRFVFLCLTRAETTFKQALSIASFSNLSNRMKVKGDRLSFLSAFKRSTYRRLV